MSHQDGAADRLPVTVPDVTPELPPGRWRATLALLARLPQGALSRTFGRVADLPLPRPLRPVVLGGFARAMGIDAGEAEKPIADYETLNRFFVRRLRPGLRRWPADPRVIASPVDGVLGQLGPIRDGELIQAKGRRYSAAALLTDDGEARRFQGGSFVTLYLSPRHYHRIHTPCAGRVPLARHIPGALLPVNAAAVAHVPELFPRNERLLCLIEPDAADPGAGDSPGASAEARPRVALVAVGAYNVGRISAAFDPAWNAPPGEGGWVTNRPGVGIEVHRYDPPVRVREGEEIMAFHLGSTVVLLLSEEYRLGPLAAGAEVRVGEEIARLKG